MLQSFVVQASQEVLKVQRERDESKAALYKEVANLQGNLKNLRRR